MFDTLSYTNCAGTGVASTAAAMHRLAMVFRRDWTMVIDIQGEWRVSVNKEKKED